MQLWREFFVLNRTIIFFVYGQVFFLLGLAIIWQSRRHSRLDLARSLGWLGIFGLTHGLHEWGDIFIPIQAEYLSQAWIEVLLLVQACLLAFSFACLFQFGAETLRPLYPQLRWLQGVPAGVLLVWLTVFFWISQVFRWEAERLVIQANIWARYLLGFPGALAAAAGLGQQTRRQIQLQKFSHIARTFRVASLALVAYAILGGLLVPPASFFPANIINADTVVYLLGMPPQVLRSLAGLVLVVSVVRGLEIFEVEVDRRLEEMEQAQILLAERERVSRELHDGAIQTVYTAGLMAESIRNKMDKTDPLALRLDRVISALHHAIHDLRRFITELEPDTPAESLVEGLRKLAEDPHLQTLIKVEMTVNCDEDYLFPSARITHVLAIVNEALSNVVRHARARQVWLTAERQNGQLAITVVDDGSGIPDKYVAGFGLRNMRDRARLLGGTLSVESRSPRGTRLMLTVPWEDPR
ncbi:MAG: sensor histidine kinase [Chloroflexota bacterium]